MPVCATVSDVYVAEFLYMESMNRIHDICVIFLFKDFQYLRLQLCNLAILVQRQEYRQILHIFADESKYDRLPV